MIPRFEIALILLYILEKCEMRTKRPIKYPREKSLYLKSNPAIIITAPAAKDLARIPSLNLAKSSFTIFINNLFINRIKTGPYANKDEKDSKDAV